MKRRKQTKASGWPPGWAPVWGKQMDSLHKQGAPNSALLLYAACCLRHNSHAGCGLDPCGQGSWTLPDAALGMGWLHRNTIKTARAHLIKAGLLTRKCNGRKPDGTFKDATYTFTPCTNFRHGPCTESGGPSLCSNNKKKHSHQVNSPKGINLMAKGVRSAGGSARHGDRVKPTAAELEAAAKADEERLAAEAARRDEAAKRGLEERRRRDEQIDADRRAREQAERRREQGDHRECMMKLLALLERPDFDPTDYSGGLQVAVEFYRPDVMREVLGDLWEPLASRWRQAEANMIKDGAIPGPLMATEAEVKVGKF